MNDENINIELTKFVKDLSPMRRNMKISRHYFREYSENSSIHGIRYIGEKDRTLPERVCWIIILIISTILCAHTILGIYQKWASAPAILSLAENPKPVWQIPFPAVTICPETKVKRRIFNFTEYYHLVLENSVSLEELKKFEDASLNCFDHLWSRGPKKTNSSSIKFIRQVAPTLTEVMWLCKIRNNITRCDNLFRVLLTDAGPCFTFNMVGSQDLLTDHAKPDDGAEPVRDSEWNVDGRYENGAGAHVYPFRAWGAGTNGGLVILMRAYENDSDHVCHGLAEGFKILLHSPTDVPRISQQYIKAPLNQDTTITVQPDMITTSEGLKEYPVSTRGCYFPLERKLKFYTAYSQQNCEVECLANYTLSRCGCVSYHMPRNSSTLICGSGSTKCVVSARKALYLRELEMNIDEKERPKESFNHIFCNCLPSCISLNYNLEVSQVHLNWPKLMDAFMVEDKFSGMHLTRVNIFFKSTHFTSLTRSELYSQAEFLASCGGLLAIFLGFSLLSLIEIFYFLTLRLWSNIKMQKRL